MELRNRGYLVEASNLSVSTVRRIVAKHAKTSLVKKALSDMGLKGAAIDEISDRELPNYLTVIFCALAAKKGVELASGLKTLCLKNAKEILNNIREAGETKGVEGE